MRRTSTDRLSQAAIVVAIAAVVALIAAQTSANLRSRGIASGYGYLGRASGFEIAPGPVSYSSRDTYARALVAGVVNTLRVALPGMAIASALGLVLGIARLSRVAVVAGAARLYVEVFRNIPLLLQLLFWYSLLQSLPPPHNRAVGFRGATASPEYAALLIGLSSCTAAYIAEIVRGGIVAVERGQWDAAASLRLSRLQTLRFVILPQAATVIVPPTTSQFLNLTKNSSLAVAIGYPDLMSITNTTLNQTGQAIEAIALMMAIYLALSGVIAWTMHRWPRHLYAA